MVYLPYSTHNKLFNFQGTMKLLFFSNYFLKVDLRHNCVIESVLTVAMLYNAIHYSYIYHFAMYFQNKYYPKDSAKDALCKGRVRVQLKQSDASFVNEKFQSSKLIYKLSVHHMTVLNAVVLYYYWLNFHYLSFQLYMYNHSLRTKEKNILYFE